MKFPPRRNRAKYVINEKGVRRNTPHPVVALNHSLPLPTVAIGDQTRTLTGGLFGALFKQNPLFNKSENPQRRIENALDFYKVLDGVTDGLRAESANIERALDIFDGVRPEKDSPLQAAVFKYLFETEQYREIEGKAIDTSVVRDLLEDYAKSIRDKLKTAQAKCARERARNTKPLLLLAAQCRDMGVLAKAGLFDIVRDVGFESNRDYGVATFDTAAKQGSPDRNASVLLAKIQATAEPIKKSIALDKMLSREREDTAEFESKVSNFWGQL